MKMQEYSIGNDAASVNSDSPGLRRSGPGLATRVALSSSLATLLLVGIMLAASIFYVSSHIRNIYVEKAYAIANAFDQGIDQLSYLDDPAALRQRIRDNVLLSPELVAVTVYRLRDAALIEVSSSQGSSGQAASPENFAAYRGNRVITRDVSGATGRVLRVFAPMHGGGETIGTLQFDLTLEKIDALRFELLGSMLRGYLPLIAVMLLLLVLYIRRRIVSPVTAIGKVAREIADGSLDTRFEVRSSDELGSLCRDFNQMLCSLERQRDAIAEAKHHFEHQALHDSLTGLPNRSFLQQRFPQYLAACKRHQRRGAFLMMDLDNFKWVNDNLGHNVGDELLMVIAQRLQRVLRQEDFVARLGGDEFVIVLSDVSSDADLALHQIKSVVDSLLESLAQTVTIDHNEIQVSASIGIVFFPGREEALSGVIKNADSAMYKAKEQGGNRGCFFDQKMQQMLLNKAKVQGTIKDAIDANQLRVFYQPQVDQNDRVIGAEALVRWLHPERGLMLPRDFISAIENSKLIVELGQWVLETVCGQYRELVQDYAAGPDFTIAINVCMSQFNRADFVDSLTGTLARYRLPPSALVLEINESTLLNNAPDARERIEALRNLGFRVSVDDYGTGFSSLTCLKDMELDEIKLDCALVQKISRSERDRDMVCAIINMSQSLNLNLVAEGVETREQYEFLKSHNCRVFQGMHFQEPLPLARLDA